MSMLDKTDDIKGRAKVAVGAVTGDQQLENEGRVDRFAHDVKKAIGDVTGTLEDWVDTGSVKAKKALKGTRTTLQGWVDKAAS
jgi:uncharacterized protein YjbJ (UPF0337 family)